MPRFRNPYHFVPVVGDHPSGEVNRNEIAAQAPHVTHDRHVQGTHSGRLVCKVVVETPLICGNQQVSSEAAPRQGWTKQLKPFELHLNPALPASSLRGMLSAVAEAASNSAMRVLVNQSLSIRHSLHPATSVHRFIPPGFRPLNPSRQMLSLAEQLLGVVEDRLEGNGESPSAPAYALASRVRISHARWTSNPPDNKSPWRYAGKLSEMFSAQMVLRLDRRITDVPLKNLASPKLPAPALYFRNRAGAPAFVRKAQLNPEHHAMQGRKFYLRRNHATYNLEEEAFVHPQRLLQPKNGELNAIAKQHQSVEKLVCPGVVFHFVIDFDNLSELELQLLAYALTPSEHFRHQIGHGKPYGMGQIQISIEGLLRVDRQRRYAEDPLCAPRWHQAWLPGGNQNSIDQWPGWLQPGPIVECKPLENRLQELKQDFRSWAGANNLSPVLGALELVGSPPSGPENEPVPVHYPQTDKWEPNDPNFERQHFRWFGQNENGAGQFLRPLVDNGNNVANQLPELERRPQNGPPSVQYAATPGAGKSQPGASPQDWAGKTVEAIVQRHIRLGHRLQIEFEVVAGSLKFAGMLAQPDPNRDATTYPVDPSRKHRFILRNPQKRDGRWHCQLERMPVR
jgi:hypothetical protein